MDQKNTIVKCRAHPNCLFNHNGICDNYVITIGADGSCQEYVETEPTIKDTVIDEGLRERFKIFLNNWKKEHPPLSKEDREIMNKIGYVPPKEEDQMCWYCDNGKHGKCKFFIKPMKDANGECCKFVSTGGNR